MAGTTDQEKAFTDKYKAAMEGADTAALESFLYTQGSDPKCVGFYKKMQLSAAGKKISIINVVSLTSEDIENARTPAYGPYGKAVCLTIEPTKKLVIQFEPGHYSTCPGLEFFAQSYTGHRENYLVEKDGRFFIPVPGPCTDVGREKTDTTKPTNLSATQRLKELQSLRDQRLISDDEFQRKRKEILDGF